MRKTLIVSLCLLVSAIAFIGCGGGGGGGGSNPVGATTTYSNSSLKETWFFLNTSDAQNSTYTQSNTDGILSDVGVFFFGSANYAVQPSGAFTINIVSSEDGSSIPLSGQFTSASGGTWQANGEAGTFSKVNNLAAAAGVWSGTLTESAGPVKNITFTVDSTGNIISFTGFTGPVSGKIFVDSSNNVVCFFKTGLAKTDSYNQVQFVGTLVGDAINGHFTNDSGVKPYVGNVALTRPATTANTPFNGGTYTSFSLNAGDAPAWLGWDAAVINFTGGNAAFTFNSDSESGVLSNQTFSGINIDSNRVITATTEPTFNGYQSASGDLIVNTNTDATSGGNAYSMGIMLKSGSASFSTADLAGTWDICGIVSGDVAQGHKPGWWRYSTAVDASGNSTPGPVTDSANVAYTPSAHTYAIDSAGLVTLPPNSNLQGRGQMNAGKNLIVGVYGTKAAPGSAGSITGTRGYNLFVMVKRGGSFSATDLNGAWKVHALTTGDAPAWLGWFRSDLSITATQNVFTNRVWGGTSAQSGGASETRAANWSITSTGVISETVDGIYGLMTSDKTFAVLIMNDGSGFTMALMQR